jgi:hypothetical protein
MAIKRSSLKPPAPAAIHPAAPIDGQPRIDWPAWLRQIERKRRRLAAMNPRRPMPLPPSHFAAITCTSFQLDGIQIDDQQVAAAVSRGSAKNPMRSRSTQRIRNHLAILHRIASAVRSGQPLKTQTVLRWYTSISCGLSNAALDESSMNRFDAIVRRINSPQLRLQPAVAEIAHLHASLLIDPFVPSFNGILARLLLQYHLGRCGLPPILFDSQSDAGLGHDEPLLLSRILDGIDSTYAVMMQSTNQRRR